MTSTSSKQAGAGALKRSHIAKQLWRSSDRGEDRESVSRLSKTSFSEVSWSDSASSSSEESDGEEEEEEEAEKDLADFAAWLEAESEKELAKIDWEPDFEHVHKQDDGPAAGVDTAILQRIRRGHGPRPSKFEDLLAPLRLTGSRRNKRYKRPLTETCESMEAALRAWNQHVASDTSDDSEARQRLVVAMHARIDFLNRALINRWSADAHDDTCRHLLNAIHLYRPETVNFTNQDPLDLLIIIIAHLGYAIPDIDDDLKHAMLYTLVTERGYSTHVSNEKSRQKYEQEITEARRRGDVAKAVKCEEKMSAWIRAGLRLNCETIIERIKTARRNVELKGLEQLQELSVLQIAQKLVLSDRIRDSKSPSELLAPRSTWWPERAKALETAGKGLEGLMDELIEDLETSQRVGAVAIDDMKDVNRRRVLTRAIKFNGLDVKNITDAQRNRLVQDRLANPGTIPMMTDAVKGLTEIKSNAEVTAASMEKMEQAMGKLAEAAGAVHFEYDELSKLVNSDPHMVLGGTQESNLS